MLNERKSRDALQLAATDVTVTSLMAAARARPTEWLATVARRREYGDQHTVPDRLYRSVTVSGRRHFNDLQHLRTSVITQGSVHLISSHLTSSHVTLFHLNWVRRDRS